LEDYAKTKHKGLPDKVNKIGDDKWKNLEIY
jgi:hypothetical protein